MIEKLNRLWPDEKGFTAYDCESFVSIKFEKGFESAHSHSESEVIFLIEGELEMTLETEKQRISAPLKITILPNLYHKFTALTDGIALEIKE